MPETTQPNARIRAANALDVEELAAAHDRAWDETYGGVVTEEVRERARPRTQWWEAALSDPLGPTTWVAVRDGAVVGFARAVAPGLGHARPLELQMLAVLAEEQGRRTGRHLLQMAVGDAPCAVWVAAGDEKTQRFYRHHGFEADGARREVPEWGDVTQLRMLR